MFWRIFLVLLWWIGMWGLIDLIIGRITGGSFRKSLIAYSCIIGFVGVAVWFDPQVIESF
jgi:hypothetical protein